MAVQESVVEIGAQAEVGTKYAGFWLRFVALLIDTLVACVVNFAVSFVFGFNTDVSATGPEGTLPAMDITGLIVLTAIWVLYFTILESSNLQGTLGKAAMSLKVTDYDGNRISLGRAFIRYVAKIASAVILLVGFLMAAFTKKKQGLHDMIASTYVVMKD